MIVLIEDNETYAKQVIKKLARNGFNKVRLFNDLDSYNHVEADIYIIDLNIQNKMSFGIIKEIREKTDRPIMILSGYSSSIYILKSFESGADCFADKLMTADVFIAKIKTLIKMYKRISSNQK